MWRLFTAIVLIGSCIPAVWLGSEIIRFRWAETHSPGGPERTAALRAWNDVPGLMALAREASFTPIDDPTDRGQIFKRRDEIARVLATAPLDSMQWLSFAAVQQASNPQSDSARERDALMMSIVTGPNEGEVLPQRIIFEASNWQSLPPTFRQRMVQDIQNARLTVPEAARLRILLGLKSEQQRSEIRSALELAGISASRIEALGL
jgi:hypothetical protein